MTVHLWEQQLSYISVPKCGCSSLKLYFYEVIHGTAFPHETMGNVHRYYRSKAFALLPHHRIGSHAKIAVVREPVARIASAYRSKVVNEACLKAQHLQPVLSALRLSAEPSLGEFLARIGSYKAVSRVVFRHFQKLSFYLGRRPDWFTRIYDLSQLSALREDIMARTGSTAALPFVNRSGTGNEAQDVSDADRRSILALFKDDVARFGQHFATPAQAG